MRSHGVVGVDEHGLQAEPLGEERADRADAEGLRRVVPACEEGDAELARLRPRVLLRLARDERVQAERGGVRKGARGAAAADADAADLVGPAGEELGLAARRLREPAGELIGRERLREGAVKRERRAPGLVEPAVDVEPER